MKLKRNTGMKLLALLCAIILWVYVAILLNPTTTATIHNVAIKFANTSEISSKNLIITNESETTFDVTIDAPRSAIARINNKNVTAVVDLLPYASPGEHEIPITLTFPMSGVTVSYQKSQTVTVDIDNVGSRTLPIAYRTSGDLPEGQSLESVTISPKNVILSGPKSALNLIDHASVNIDLGNLSPNLDETINLYDSNGTEIYNKLITFDNTDATVNVQVTNQ